MGEHFSALAPYVEKLVVFVSTPLAGTALGIAIKEVIQYIVKDVAKKIESRKGNEIDVTLYGPDGKKIDWKNFK